jgi:protein-S-isoprenylcysteine O-methyltransferase Ste14
MMKVPCCLLLLTAVQAFQAPSPVAFSSSKVSSSTLLKAAPPTKKAKDIDYEYDFAQEDVEVSFPSSRSSSAFSMEDLKNFKLPENLQMPDNIKMPDFSSLAASFSEGEFGSRGEVYFAAQAVLMLAIVFGGNLPFLDTALFITGPTLLLGGLAVVVLSASDLGEGLSPFTTPSARNALKTEGLYSYVRHPMYAGLLAAMAGFSLISDSATRLLLTAMLFAVFNVKSEMEEVELQKMYPGQFARYQQTVTGKFFPNEWWEQVQPSSGKSGGDSGNKMSP